jgi:hypothetical protein
MLSPAYNNTCLCYNGIDTIQWIEKLLQIPIADHRKYAIWQILIPYLFNFKNLSDTIVTNIIQDWLNKYDETRALDFNAEYSIRQHIRNGKRYRYLPIGINKPALKIRDCTNLLLRDASY